MLVASALLAAASGCRNKQQEEPPPAPGTPGAERASPRPTEGTGQMPRDQQAPGTGTAGTPGTTGAPGDPQASQDSDLAILTITVVDVDTKLAALCGMPDTKVYFKFDSANLSADAKERLDQIAKCATSGPAKGRELLVVGHADPTGADAYNKQLGKSRAASVSEHLRGQGVQSQRVEIESKGEATASASPPGWPADRRVTVRLADEQAR